MLGKTMSLLKTATNAESAITLVKEARPHLFLVDLQTPGLEIAALGDAVRGLPDAVCPIDKLVMLNMSIWSRWTRLGERGFDQVLTRGQIQSAG